MLTKNPYNTTHFALECFKHGPTPKEKNLNSQIEKYLYEFHSNF